jgi:hypothetical protein
MLIHYWTRLPECSEGSTATFRPAVELNVCIVNISQVHDAFHAVIRHLPPAAGNALCSGAEEGCSAWCWVSSMAAGSALPLAWR